MDEDPKAKPWMPRIKYCPLFGPVGVMWSSRTTLFDRTLRSAIDHPHRGLHTRAPGFAVWISYARRALAGAKTNPALTSLPDHSIGAGHEDVRYMALPAA